MAGTIPEATFPDGDWNGNPQDTANDGAADDTLEQGGDYNRTSAEVMALAQMSRGKISNAKCHSGLVLPMINNTGGALTVGKMVVVNGYDSTADLPQMAYAAADLASYRDLAGLLVLEKGGDVDSVADGEVGYVLVEGFAYGLIDTSSFTAGDPLWLAASGALSKTVVAGHPPVAECDVSHASTGVLKVFCGGSLVNGHIQGLGATLNKVKDLEASPLAANTNDYNPADLQTSGILRLTTDGSGPYDLTGITAPTVQADGRQIIVWNIHASDIITVKDEDANSAAANRFALGGDIALGHDEGATFIYDATSSRWRCAGRHN